MIGRRNILLGFAALPVGHAISGRSATSSGVGTVANISALIEAERAKSGIPALGAATSSSRGMQAIGVAGVRAFPDGPLVTALDQWHIGSCTKSFTATLAARLIERRLLRWDSTIAEILGGQVHRGWHDIPLLWLLSHRSGAPNNFDQLLWENMVTRGGSLRDQRAYIVREGLKSPPASKPNSATAYSNAGYMIAGAMLEKSAGEAWEALIRREVFLPLRMTDFGFGAPGTPGKLDQPLGHTRGDNGRWKRIPLGPGDDNPAATGPAGTIHLSLRDWSNFASAHLKGGRGADRFLSRSSWVRLHTPGESDWEYSPGWIVKRHPKSGERMMQHLGSNNFFVAQATLFPARDRAVLLVTNLGDDAAEPPFSRLLDRLQYQ